MGFAPDQVGRMSHWQFMAALDGWSRAHGGKKSAGAGKGMSEERLADLGIEGF